MEYDGIVEKYLGIDIVAIHTVMIPTEREYDPKTLEIQKLGFNPKSKIHQFKIRFLIRGDHHLELVIIL